MKDNENLKRLISQLPSLTCFIGAILMSFNGIAGWGWMLVVGVLISDAFI